MLVHFNVKITCDLATEKDKKKKQLLVLNVSLSHVHCIYATCFIILVSCVYVYVV